MKKYLVVNEKNEMAIAMYDSWKDAIQFKNFLYRNAKKGYKIVVKNKKDLVC